MKAKNRYVILASFNFAETEQLLPYLFQELDVAEKACAKLQKAKDCPEGAILSVMEVIEVKRIHLIN